MYDVIVVGGGPAGVFAALQLKNKRERFKVLVLEKSNDLLTKVKLSGGGRCNITNATADIRALSLGYPRGNKELISAFNQFSPNDMMKWLEGKGVALKIDENNNNRVFPVSDKSQTIIDCFKHELERLNIEILYNQDILKICRKDDVFELYLNDDEIYKSRKVILATGSSDKGSLYAKNLGHDIKPFIPSLFSFKIANSEILKLSGLSVNDVKVSLKGTSYSNVGSILITHEGVSGPCIINLSSIAAEFLKDNDYKAPIGINWLYKQSRDQIIEKLIKTKEHLPNKTLLSINPFGIKKRLWSYFLDGFGVSFLSPIKNVSNKKLIKLVEKLCFDTYFIISRSLNKGEFVSCGGVNRKEINFKDMQSKICKNLYIVGELLDIDGITGGYNLQNAWTTGYISGISASVFN